MEIIQEGNAKNYRTYQYKCSCGCRFNADFPADFKEGTCLFYVLCPCCGKTFTRSFFARMRYLFNSESISDL